MTAVSLSLGSQNSLVVRRRNKEETVKYVSDAWKQGRGRVRTAALALSFLCLPVPLLAAEAVVVPFPHDFAESITATSDGTLIFSSFAGGRISHAKAGTT